MFKIPNIDSNKDSFDARLVRHQFHWQSGDSRLQGDFFYLPFRDGKPTTDEFLTYLATQMLNYAIPFNKRMEAYSVSNPSDLAPITALKKEAKDLFQRATNTGEFGELILYLILRDFFDAPQVVCKMSLKTNPNLPVFGADALHMGFIGSTMVLYHGESKMFSDKTPNNAIEKSIQSSKAFLKNKKSKNGARARDFEINLISSHFSIPQCSEEQKKAILAYLNPLKKEHNNSKDVAVCLVGFDMDFYKQHHTLDGIEQLFAEKYRSQIDEATNIFESQVKKQSLSQYNFHFILLPFESITDFREKFLEILDEM